MKNLITLFAVLALTVSQSVMALNLRCGEREFMGLTPDESGVLSDSFSSTEFSWSSEYLYLTHRIPMLTEAFVYKVSRKDLTFTVKEILVGADNKEENGQCEVIDLSNNAI